MGLPKAIVSSSLEDLLHSYQSQLLTCQQCRRVMKSTRELWEINVQQSPPSRDSIPESFTKTLCSQCFPQGTRKTSIFASLNSPSAARSNHNHVQDVGIVIPTLQQLLVKIRSHERKRQEKSTTESALMGRYNEGCDVSDSPPSSPALPQNENTITTDHDTTKEAAYWEELVSQKEKLGSSTDSHTLPWERPGPRIYRSLDPNFLGPDIRESPHRAPEPVWFRTNIEGEWEAFSGTKQEWKRIQAQRRREKEEMQRQAEQGESDSKNSRIAEEKTPADDVFAFECKSGDQEQQEDGHTSPQNSNTQKQGLPSAKCTTTRERILPSNAKTPMHTNVKRRRSTTQGTVLFDMEKQTASKSIALASSSTDRPFIRRRRSKSSRTPSAASATAITASRFAGSNSSQRSLPETADFDFLLQGSQGKKSGSTSSSLESGHMQPEHTDKASQSIDNAGQDSSNSSWLPETNDFERICPGPPINVPQKQQSSDSQPSVDGRPKESFASNIFSSINSRTGFSQSSQVEESSNSSTWIPETEEFEKICPGPKSEIENVVDNKVNQGNPETNKTILQNRISMSEQKNVPGSQNESGWLPETAEFERAYTGSGREDNLLQYEGSNTTLKHVEDSSLMYRATQIHNDVPSGNHAAWERTGHSSMESQQESRKAESCQGNSQQGSSAESSQVFQALSPLTESFSAVIKGSSTRQRKNSIDADLGVVTPALPLLKRAMPNEDEITRAVPSEGPVMITPSNAAVKKATTDDVTMQHLLQSNENTRQASQRAVDTFICESRQHPFDQSGSRSVYVCARTFRYLFFRAHARPVCGPNGESIWGDGTIYDQTVATLSDTGIRRPWLRQSLWWDSHVQSPANSIVLGENGNKIESLLLSGYSILVVSDKMCTSRKNALPACNQATATLGTRSLGIEFGCLSEDEVIALCRAAGATIVESAASSVESYELIVLIPEEIDDEELEKNLVPKLVEEGVLQASSSLEQSKKQQQLSFTYYSWLVESIASGIVAPTTPFNVIESQGTGYEDRGSTR